MSESQTPRTDDMACPFNALTEGTKSSAGVVFEVVPADFARELESELTATRARLAQLEVAVRNEISYALHEADYPCNRHSGEGYGMRKVAERIQKAIKAYKEGKK